jgi:exodeoxyribonuclease-3
MRVLSWNVNGIRAAHRHGFVEWLRSESPDILCVQEIKAKPEQVPEVVRYPADSCGHQYSSYWAPAQKAGYAGVAIYSLQEPQTVQTLGVPEFDAEGRVLLAEYAEWTLICAYFPNAQDAGKRLSYKLAFCDAIRRRCDTIVSTGRHVVVCGDYNIAHGPLDLAHPEGNEQNAGYLPEERAWMDSFIGAGYVDTFRYFHPGEGGHYSWWSYRSGARPRNIGWRLDYCYVDAGFIPQVQSAGIKTDVPGADHCPVEIILEV